MALRRLFALLCACAFLGLATGCETANNDDKEDTKGTVDTGGGGSVGPCKDFCADMVAACPEDDTIETCETSCDEADKEPSATALECAAAATDCTATHACWPLLYN
jgi:hypothetical protein